MTTFSPVQQSQIGTFGAPGQPDAASYRREPTLPSNSPELVLIRGLPGSGKSTMARVLVAVGYEHYEADMYFEQGGVYRYDSARIRDAHTWCQANTRRALVAGRRVVVSNTFTRLQEMAPYWSMTSNLRILEATGRWSNVHEVPPERLQQMAERWESLEATGAARHPSG